MGIMMDSRTLNVSLLALVAALAPASLADDAAPPWQDAERGILRNHVQLTFAEEFERAGEAYFSPDGQRIIFQAVEAPPEGEAPEDFFTMFIADVVYDVGGLIAGIENITAISPPGSANTCGWFHPHNPEVVIFGSTVGEPSESTPPGYQRATGRYRWMFPPEMDIVQMRVPSGKEVARSPDGLTVLVARDDAYVAEGSLSPCGRYLLYCSLESNEGDLFVKDMKTQRVTRIVEARGYDGGPFFSPDGRRICYRSDRRGDNLLQLFIGELAFNAEGEVVGLKREFQLTDNEHVNWAPFWHPGGRHLVYATSEVSHRQYEVFLIDADPGNVAGSTGTTRYGTNMRRVTHAEGFDGLPVFDATGRWMMWTSQRDEGRTSQLWVAEFVMPLDPPKGPARLPGAVDRGREQ
jgi:TolB protein